MAGLNDVLEGLVRFLFETQRAISQEVGATIGSYTADPGALALLGVLPLGVAFGAIHALTPGHSKTVLVAYIAGSPLSILRGIGVAVVLSAMHVFSAVLIAVLALPLISTALGSVGRAPLLDDVSRGLLGLIGAWMIFRAFARPTHTHREGPLVCVVAGLVPCPLTLFAMALAMRHDALEIGLAFVTSMMVGIGLTLSIFTAVTVITRQALAAAFQRDGGAFGRVSRLLEGIAGTLLVLIGLRELLGLF